VVETTTTAPAATAAAGAPQPTDYAPAGPAPEASAAPAVIDPYAAFITRWKAQHKDVIEITVIDDDNTEVRCFHHNPDRNVIAQALTMVMNKKVVEAGEFVLMNTWLGGDERCNPNNPGADDSMVVAASKEAAGNINLLASRSKKL
jgi:hypothetical protein